MDLANRGTLELTVMVIEKASATIDRHLMALTTGIAGLAHFELPEFLRELELLRADRPDLWPYGQRDLPAVSGR